MTFSFNSWFVIIVIGILSYGVFFFFIIVSIDHDIALWFFEILQELNEQKQLTETMRTSIVKIFYKKGDRRMIGNYRPLSLALIDYKILAKIVTEGIKPALKQIIGMEQQGFIQEKI